MICSDLNPSTIVLEVYEDSSAAYKSVASNDDVDIDYSAINAEQELSFYDD